jgi:hypothetical protein
MSKVALPLVAFLVFTAYTVLVVRDQGLAAFIPTHTMHGPLGWPLQVFTDLVLMGLGFLTLAVPDARRRGIDIRPYVVVTVLLGSIGMLAYFVRRGLASDESTGRGA